MKIVGFTGAIGSGKTTLAKLIGKQAPSTVHYESWMVISEVANELRQETHPRPDDIRAVNQWLQRLPAAVKRVTNTHLPDDAAQLTPDKLRAHPEHYQKLFEYLELIKTDATYDTGEITEDNKEVYRSILQWLGGYLVYGVGPGIWYDEIVRRISAEPDIAVVTVGGVRYPGDAERITGAGGSIIRVDRPSIATKDGTDLTERERTLIHADAVVLNDSDLLHLEMLAESVYADLEQGTLAPTYISSGFPKR